MSGKCSVILPQPGIRAAGGQRLSRKIMAAENPHVARPFLKWAGGKAKLAQRVVALAPEAFGRYHEPFVGAGAVFFALAEARGLQRRAALADANPELIACYRAVRDVPAELIARLQMLSDGYLGADETGRPAFYYEQRATVPDDPVQRAARFIFLNKTCYNGLYRVNSRGGFNVPHGRYTQPRILDAEGLRAAAAALAGADLCAGDFETACRAADPGDFVYLDPPYQPLSATSRFTSYTSGDFGPDEQVRLRDAFDDLTRRGVFAVLSNSDHPVVRDLYGGRGYECGLVEMSRAINSKGAGRAPISELLINNFAQL
jgi:DNA adenine methylase